MNKVCLIGRLTKNPELRYNKDNIAVVRFTLAVNRNFTNSEGEREADFISCIAWRKTAELICKHFQKGTEFGAFGRIQTGKYENDKGETIFTTDVVVDEITFVGSKKEERPLLAYTGQVQETQKEENDPFAEFERQINIEDDKFLD